MHKKFKLASGVALNAALIATIQKNAKDWQINLTTGEKTVATFEELPYLAKICGPLVQVNETLFIHVCATTLFEPNGEGYKIGVLGVQPIQISKEKGDALLFEYGETTILSEEILDLQNKGQLPDFKKLG